MPHPRSPLLFATTLVVAPLLVWSLWPVGRPTTRSPRPLEPRSSLVAAPPPSQTTPTPLPKGKAPNQVDPKLAEGFALAVEAEDWALAAHLLEFWLQVDEVAALAAAAALSPKLTEFGTPFFAELSAHFDRQTARRALATILEKLALQPDLQQALAKDRYQEFARIDLADAIQWLGEHAELSELSKVLALDLGLHQRSNAAIDIFGLPQLLPNQELQAACLLGIIDSWVEVDPLAVTSALVNLPLGSEIEPALALALTRLARTQPSTAMELAEALETDELRNATIQTIAQIWRLADPDASEAANSSP